MGRASQRRRDQMENKNNAMAAIAHAEAYSNLKVDYDNLLKENERLRNEVKSLKEEKLVGETSTVGLEFTELKVQNDKLEKKINSLSNQVESLKEMLVGEKGKVNPLAVQVTPAQNVYRHEITSQPTYSFNPNHALHFRPHLCPRFPQRKETLPIDAGFNQSRILKKIFSFYSSKGHFPDSGLVSPMVAPSVVVVSSFFGLERKFDFSGLVIHWSSSEEEATILTSAKLLWNPEDSEYEFHLIVRMADGTLLLAREEHVDYYHNLLTLKVKSTVELEVVDLRSRQADIVDGMKVISLGRDFDSFVLQRFTGELSEERSKFGCDELLTSSCVIRKICEGGPLVTDGGDVVGITFFGRDERACPLPTPTILSFLEMWKSSSTVVRPWFGMRVFDLYEICKELSIPFRKRIICGREIYVFVEEVYEGSVAHRNNVSVGDSVYALNGTRSESVKQYSQMLSDASRAVTAGDSVGPLTALIMSKGCPTNEINIEAEYIPVDDKRFSFCWPRVNVDEWLRSQGGLENPGFLCWPPEEEDKC